MLGISRLGQSISHWLRVLHVLQYGIYCRYYVTDERR